VPDLPGRTGVADTREEALRLIRQGIEPHSVGLREGSWPVPTASSTTDCVQVKP